MQPNKPCDKEKRVEDERDYDMLNEINENPHNEEKEESSLYNLLNDIGGDDKHASKKGSSDSKSSGDSKTKIINKDNKANMIIFQVEKDAKKPNMEEKKDNAGLGVTVCFQNKAKNGNIQIDMVKDKDVKIESFQIQLLAVKDGENEKNTQKNAEKELEKLQQEVKKLKSEKVLFNKEKLEWSLKIKECEDFAKIIQEQSLAHEKNIKKIKRELYLSIKKEYEAFCQVKMQFYEKHPEIKLIEEASDKEMNKKEKNEYIIMKKLEYICLGEEAENVKDDEDKKDIPNNTQKGDAEDNELEKKDEDEIKKSKRKRRKKNKK